MDDSYSVSDADLKILVEQSRETNGDDPEKITRGVLNILEYNQMVSNL